MHEDDRTLITWYPVDDNLAPVDVPEGTYPVHGAVRDVPAPGDAVNLGHGFWEVVRRVWSVPVPHEGARTPRQVCSLWIRKVDR